MEKPAIKVAVCEEEGSAADLRRAWYAGIPAPSERPCQAALSFGSAAYTCAAAGVSCELAALPDLQEPPF